MNYLFMVSGQWRPSKEIPPKFITPNHLHIHDVDSLLYPRRITYMVRHHSQCSLIRPTGSSSAIPSLC